KSLGDFLFRFYLLNLVLQKCNKPYIKRYQQAKMTYYTFHLNDSGALEYETEIDRGNSKILICEMYNGEEFNKLNDILFSTHFNGYVLNNKALNIFKELNLPKHFILPASVKRKEKFLTIIPITKSYKYNYLKFDKKDFDRFYEWIDFDKSDIWVTKSKKEFKKLESHQERLYFIEQNGKLKYSESYSFVSKKIVFKNSFDQEIDMFKIPFYSSGTYISERFFDKIKASQLSDVLFAKSKDDIGKVWKSSFPIIEFTK
ncbi:hypothetical protein, partial [Tenacibaculum finnmarkense]|uniref:hypothetical protein n=1 Tax=Tenacibaculum finnmarkense TaxID=2781243 RepID=UPI003BB77249